MRDIPTTAIYRALRRVPLGPSAGVAGLLVLLSLATTSTDQAGPQAPSVSDRETATAIAELPAPDESRASAARSVAPTSWALADTIADLAAVGEAVPDEVIVSVAPGLDPGALATIAGASGFDVVRVFAQASAARLRVRPGQRFGVAIATLTAHPLIDHVAPNTVTRGADRGGRFAVESGYVLEGADVKVRWDSYEIVLIPRAVSQSCEQLIAIADAGWAKAATLEAKAVTAMNAFNAALLAQQNNIAATAAAKTKMDAAKVTFDAKKKCYDARTCPKSQYDAALAAYNSATTTYNNSRNRQAALDQAEDVAKHASDDASKAHQDAVAVALKLDEDAEKQIWEYEENLNGAVPGLAELQWTARHLGLNEAVEQGISGSGVTVAVLDTGVAFESWNDGTRQYAKAPDLAHVTFVHPWDVLADDAHPNDANGHGTQMTTLIAGVGAAYAIAPNVQIMPVRVLDDAKVGTEADLIEGILWAANKGADVINMSLAFPSGYTASPALESALALASASGAVLVAAAGNAGIDATPYPAAAREVIAVGAYEPNDLRSTEARGRRARYSNGDARIDLVAPMGSLDADSNGDGLPDAAFSMSFAEGQPLAFGYYFTAGTSGAAAEVSAVVALLLEAGDAPEQVRSRLHRTTKRYDLGSDPIVPGMGAGQLDAGTAVKDAVEKPFDVGCGVGGDLFVNPVGVITRKSVSEARADFVVEVIDAAGLPMKDVRLMGRVRGSTNEPFDVKTDGSGIAGFKSAVVDPRSRPQGLAWTLELNTAVADQSGCGKWIRRPVVFTRIDRATLLLFTNFGTGLGSSSLVAFIDPTAGTAISARFDKDPYHGTYLHRSFGTGLGSSSLIGVYNDVYMRSFKLHDSAVVMRTFGTGLGSSSLVADSSYFSPTRYAAIPKMDLIVRSYATGGTGLGSSSIVAGGAPLSWTEFTGALNKAPGVMYVDYGLGGKTFAMVFDLGLLKSSLLASTAAALLTPQTNAATGGMGLASSSRVASFSPSLMTSLGYDTQTTSYLQVQYTTGLNLETRPLVRNYALARTGTPLAAWSPSIPEPTDGASFGTERMPAQP